MRFCFLIQMSVLVRYEDPLVVDGDSASVVQYRFVGITTLNKNCGVFNHFIV